MLIALIALVTWLAYSAALVATLYLAVAATVRLIVEPSKGTCTSTAKLQGKVALITGGNSGIGLETARDLARRGAKVIIACRNTQRSEESIADIVKTTGNSDIHHMHLDLAKFSSVRKFAEEFNKRYDHLHILVNNAGCAGLPSQPSEDGIDLVMQVNYFGPFLLTNLLLDKLIASKPSRIVIVSSYAQHIAWKFNVHTLKAPVKTHFFIKYSISKLCNVLWMRALAKRLPEGVTVNSLHPGIVETDITRNGSYITRYLLNWTFRTIFKTAVEGAQTSVHLCVAPELEGVTGKHFQDCKPAPIAKKARDGKTVKEVWEESINLTSYIHTYNHASFRQG